ncbi:hypothetical protein ADICYQ_5506 [Cyclobacterium qasimii M12-11B]|uniref:Mannosyltransferase n=3 Tax=Cyclobacterium qasimii TaxID=1350429 RepID=S7V5X7_9BACT|nr:hypothetical protein ADICYQ_5506 [Cyclobacterium qasimii M12-11B]GEO19565.1 hypothetical protein CQA01_00990 [Cyclobacterium qasimii]
MGYFLPRSAFIPQLTLFSLCFGAYLFLVHSSKKHKYSFGFIVLSALVLRLLLMGAWPVLSDDFYRYFFDGQLIGNGINPYAALPGEVLANGAIPKNVYWETLLNKMNSPNYFSVYPPLHQLFFWISTWVGEDVFLNIVSLRCIVLIFEMINLWLIKEILISLKLPSYRLAWYAFNPLVIMEVTGNLHFEGIVLTGLLIALFYYSRQNEKKTALGWSLAVGLKLSPLLTAPVWLNTWKKPDFIKFTLVTILALLVFFAPLIVGGGLTNFYSSFRLYQSTFEFNASIYYELRWLSGFFIDYNPIGSLGPSLNFIAAALLLGIGLIKKNRNTSSLAAKMVWMYLVFLLLQTTVHPWYLIPALGISLFTANYLFIVWSGLVFLSYHAYSHPEFVEDFRIIALEYLLLFIALVLTGYRHYKNKSTVYSLPTKV